MNNIIKSVPGMRHSAAAKTTRTNKPQKMILADFKTTLFIAENNQKRALSSDVLTSMLNLSGRIGKPSRFNTHSLTGVFPSLSTPFKRMKNESVSYKNFEQNLIKWARLPFNGNFSTSL